MERNEQQLQDLMELSPIRPNVWGIEERLQGQLWSLFARSATTICEYPYEDYVSATPGVDGGHNPIDNRIPSRRGTSRRAAC